MIEANKIYVGDCIEIMKTWPDNFVDTIITDPPYGLDFMGKDWDGDVPGVHFWSEMLRVCKPGATLLSFGGTRTWHHLATAIERAGWQIRDCLMWIYGSGFPKSLDISKAIDKAKGAEREVIGEATGARNGNGSNADYGDFGSAADGKYKLTAPATEIAREWSGWGTALKPAWEPIIVAMKPLDGTFAENAEKWGVAGINVDGGRIGTTDELSYSKSLSQNVTWGKSGVGQQNPRGRWPANLLLDEDAAAMLDGQSGASVSQVRKLNGNETKPPINAFGDYRNRTEGGVSDSGGASRFFYVAKSARAERNEGCEDLPDVIHAASNAAKAAAKRGETYDKSVSGINRVQIVKNNHPTVKPLSLMKYLCQLTRTPTGGIVLDPFCGSGTTLWAAEFHNRPWIGIEMNPEYVAIANARIARERSQIKMAI